MFFNVLCFTNTGPVIEKQVIATCIFVRKLSLEYFRIWRWPPNLGLFSSIHPLQKQNLKISVRGEDIFWRKRNYFLV